MKKYNIQNYIRYKEDVKKSIYNLEGKFWDEYTRDELIVKFLPLVENIARKFSTSDQASGVLSINDLIQEGSIGLIKAVDKLDINRVIESDDPEKTIKSFLAKRIKGTIRRAININRGDMRIPEYKLNEIQKDFGKDKALVAIFFNSVFKSIDIDSDTAEKWSENIPDTSEPYNIALMNTYLTGLCKKYLSDIQYEVLRLSYGLDCDKMPGKAIAEELNFKGPSGYVRVSELKKQAIEKLIDSVDPTQVLDYL
jgi:RNA polymerase sigma factor (sigma-70 family)|tara:strand:+ start:1156 stop:1914 length:759 start_codon:yes stop_codon:yes gene_type:complete